jgi:uncharacterized protein YciI
VRAVFLMSGRKVPREGSIIIAQGISREEVDALIRPIRSTRPTSRATTEFAATMTAAALAAYRAE